ncbi:MAG: FtsX-like permease family protein, partial [Balneolaceae bacterium]|nr:FtsX-like permease family protein [Balneolaceae bacterium]
ALLMGILLAELFLPLFNALSGTALELQFGYRSVLFFISLAMLVSLVSGIYPALILSGFRPADVLKGKLSIRADNSFFRKGMVVFQFSLSIFLIASTLSVNRQPDFLRSKDLGYQKQQVLILQTDAAPAPGSGLMSAIEEAETMVDLLRSLLESQPGITGIAASLYTPAEPGWINVDFRDQNGRRYVMNINVVNACYLRAMGINITRGRYFSEEISTDRRRGVIVNEALVEAFGLENPIGQQLPGLFEDHEIVGVTENFNYESLYSEVEPLALSINPQILLSGVDNIGFQAPPIPRIALKLASGDIPATMDAIQRAWEQVAPGAPFTYTFLDQAVDNRYRQEERLSKIAGAGSSLAIVIACLGLFGLAALMIARRTKEIGVRKVLGASSTQIVMLVNRELTRLVALSFVIAVPVSWYAMQQWLQDFAYRIDIGFGVFLLSGLGALATAWISVSYQSVKAACMGPVDSLRNE